jgi:hypothetical protein
MFNDPVTLAVISVGLACFSLGLNIGKAIGQSEGKNQIKEKE